MSTLHIRKSWKGLPLELINVLVFLLPIGLMFSYDLSYIVLVLLMVYTLLVLASAYYVVVYLRLKSYIAVSAAGIEFEDKDFFAWDAIESYGISEEKDEYHSAEIGTKSYAIVQRLCIQLKNATLLYYPVTNLDKKPTQIIALLDEKRLMVNSLT